MGTMWATYGTIVTVHHDSINGGAADEIALMAGSWHSVSLQLEASTTSSDCVESNDSD